MPTPLSIAFATQSVPMDARVQATPGAEHLGHLTKPQLYAQLARATAMLYPAEFDETSCIAAIESQACGLPIVTVARGALPETVHPEAGILLPPGPQLRQRFADQVVELVHDPARRLAMGAAGRAHAAQYDAQAVAAHWEELFLGAFQQRAQRSRLAIARTLLERGDADAAAAPASTPQVSAGAPWPGLGPKLQAAILAPLQGCKRVVILGDPQLAMSLSNSLSCIVEVVRGRPEALPPCDGVLDLGQLLYQADRAAFLTWLAQATAPGTRLVHLLPSGGGIDTTAQRVHPTYDDLLRWFGDDAAVRIGLTLEGESPGALPARAWVVSYPAGSARCAPDRPARKRLLTRPRATVSACLIVRDAADTLLTTLRSIEAVVDEIHISDTGSKDGTVELIELFAKRSRVAVHLQQRPWPHDFSAARNQSISAATGDWILWIDADERLIGGQHLRRHLESEHYEAFAIRQHNHIFDAGSTQVEIPFRLFRNGQGYRFFGAVHEHPEQALNVAIEPWTVMTGVDILHYGYLTERGRLKKCLDRNLALLNRDLELYPGRILTKILYLRDSVNLCNFDLRADKPIRPDHARALRESLDMFEESFFEERGRYYHLGRGYYDRGLQILGLGRPLHIAISGEEGAPSVRHFVRHPEDAARLTLDATFQFFAGASQ